MPTSDDHRPAPTERELEDEDRRRSEVTVQDLLEADLADPATRSRRLREVSPAAGFDDRPDPGRIAGMEIEGLRDWRDPDDERPRHAKDTDDLPPL